jgi:hypothetical protein
VLANDESQAPKPNPPSPTTLEFQRLFSGSQLSFATFKPNGQENEKGKVLGDYCTLRRAPKLEDYERHLAGEIGLVIVPTREDGSCVFAMIDKDFERYAAEDAPEVLNDLRKKVAQTNLPLYFFPSKSGAVHLAVFFDFPQPAAMVIELLRSWLPLLELPSDTEIFPKQTTVSSANKGNCVSLPFFGDDLGFETWRKNFTPLNLTTWLVAWQAREFTSQHLPIFRTQNGNVLAKIPRTKKGVSFQEELAKVLKFRVRPHADGSVSYDYHGVDQQPCLLKGALHQGDAANPRMSRFVETKDGGIYHQCFSTTCQGQEEGKTRAALRALGIERLVLNVSDGSDWREHVKSKAQLTNEQPKFLVEGLIPEKALTFVVAPSYNCKTWFCLQAAQAISTASRLWRFGGPNEPLPVVYHVPEMHEALVRQYMDKLGIEDSEMFLVRTMEQGVWPLDDRRMLRSSEGRAVFLDTTGYFNPAEDSSDYKQSLKFAVLVYQLLNAGCRAVIGLYHPPKYSKDETAWTLENSILGSAGYGGILRSCLRMKNLNADLNDANVQVYVQGLKNPGLKPFQLGGVPLRLTVAPGESPYLKDLTHQDPVWLRACSLFNRGDGVNSAERTLKKEFGGKAPSHGKVCTWHRKWEEEQEPTQATLNIDRYKEHFDEPANPTDLQSPETAASARGPETEVVGAARRRRRFPASGEDAGGRLFR